MLLLLVSRLDSTTVLIISGVLELHVLHVILDSVLRTVSFVKSKSILSFFFFNDVDTDFSILFALAALHSDTLAVEHHVWPVLLALFLKLELKRKVIALADLSYLSLMYSLTILRSVTVSSLCVHSVPLYFTDVFQAISKNLKLSILSSFPKQHLEMC